MFHPPEPLTTSLNRFSLLLYSRLAESPGNLFVSPYSIASALGMAVMGAQGNTQQQMLNALFWDRYSPPELLIGLQGLEHRLQELQAAGTVRLESASALFPQTGFPLREAFLALLDRVYGAVPTQVDYINQAELARLQINAWAAEQTHQRIPELIPMGVLDSLTRLVLVNAIYFKGDWLHPFPETATAESLFYAPPAPPRSVPLMAKTATFPYARMDGFQVLELPYTGEQIAMLVLLPEKADGLPAVERALTPELLKSSLEALTSQEVAVYLPRFKLETAFHLNKPLISLGMRDAFDVTLADFRGMDTSPEGLFISAVLHKAFVDVNEEGTEAAAATAVVMALRALVHPQVAFRADHPFLFLIRDLQNGVIYFIGRYLGPTG
jgi:serpin B